MGSVAHAVVEFDEAVQAPWRPPLVVVAGGRCAAWPSNAYRGATRAGVGRPLSGPAAPVRRSAHPTAAAAGRGGAATSPQPSGRLAPARPVRGRPVVAPGRGAVPLRLTRRARRLGIVLGLGIGVALGSWFGAVVSDGDEGLRLAGETSVVVRSGDSVWSIARSVAGDADVRPVVDAIQELNGIDGGHLVPGQVLRLP